MTRKERTQQNRFDKKIAPILEELTALCEKFDMPMLAAVQLFENDETGAHVEASATHPKLMSLPMTLSTSLMRGTTKVRIQNNMLQLVMPKTDFPEELKPFVNPTQTFEGSFEDADLEPLVEHATHCKECNELMQEAILRGERIDNIVVPNHEDMNLVELLEEVRNAKIPFIMPKNNIIH